MSEKITVRRVHANEAMDCVEALADVLIDCVEGGASVSFMLPISHRADVAKMLVHREARRQGVAGRLMAAADDAAREAGKSVLVLDTVTGGDAERLYERAGWQRVGVIPNYALMPDGEFCSTTFFHKQLPSR